MARIENTDIIERFEEFYRNYYRSEIGELAQKYPIEQRSLYVDWEDIYRFDPDLADDFMAQPEQMREYAEEALRLYDLPVDVKLGQAHVRVHNLAETTEIRNLRAQHRGQLVAIEGVPVEVEDPSPVLQQGAFECQRCGTLTRIPQTSGEYQEPHECQGCERQGPFSLNFNQSEFVERQTFTLRDLAAPRSTTAGKLRVHLEDDIAGTVSLHEPCRVTGVLHLQQADDSLMDAPAFDFYLTGLTVSAITPTSPDDWPAPYPGPTATPDAPAEDTLETFVARSRAILNTEQLGMENWARAKIITPFLDVLGWNIYSDEVAIEYTEPDIDKRPDYVLQDADGTPAVAVEAKHTGKSLSDHVSQLKEYMRIFRTDYGLLTNGERYLLYQTQQTDDGLDEVQIMNCDLEELLDATALSAITREAIHGEPANADDESTS